MKWSSVFHFLSIFIGLLTVIIFVISLAGVSLSFLGAFNTDITNNILVLLFTSIWLALITLIHQVRDQAREEQV